MQVAILQKLIGRGDKVYIANGKLGIKPQNGGNIPPDWFEQNHDELVSQILDLLGIECFVFDSFTTGMYGKNRYSGVTLRFESFAQGGIHYCVFNAETRYKNAPNKGKPLPNKQFRISKNSKFYKFLKHSGFVFPKRLSAIHDYMGNLKGILFTATVIEQEKLDKNSIKPLYASYEKILELMVQKANNSQTTSGQLTDKPQTILPNIDFTQSQSQSRIETKKDTGNEKYDISNQDGAIQVTGDSSQSEKKRPEEQTDDEWWADYDAASGSW